MKWKIITNTTVMMIAAYNRNPTAWKLFVKLIHAKKQDLKMNAKFELQHQKQATLPGSVARLHTSVTDSISRSGGACKTIVVEPTTHNTQPSIPKICNFSFKIISARTALQQNIYQQSKTWPIRFRPQNIHHSKMECICLIMMLSAPRGVTRIAGAKAYAAKLATSPTTTVNSHKGTSECTFSV